ncbi:glycosyltransferase family 39 protein, partial [Micromonospora zhanjiangensis]
MTSDVTIQLPRVPAEPDDPWHRPVFAWGPVGLVAGVLAVTLMATSGGYGYHRDELYFRLLSQDLSWGFVDQPPATPILAWLSTSIFGDNLFALRFPGALVVAATAVLTAQLAREFGAARGGQVLAALGVASVFPLTFGHVLFTATLDLLVGAAVLLCVTRALLRDVRWWLAAGGVAGLGLYNKYLIVLTLVAIVAGLLLAGHRRTVASHWLWAGAAIALLVGAPNLIYQATHDWPQFTMAGAIARDKGTESRLMFLPMQLVLLGLFLAPVWMAGLVRLLRDPALRPARSLAFAYPVCCALVLLSGGQPYYTLALVLGLYAAGCAPTVRWLAGRPGRRL